MSSHWKRTEAFHEAKAEKWAAEDDDREQIAFALEYLAAGGGAGDYGPDPDELLRLAHLIRGNLI